MGRAIRVRNPRGELVEPAEVSASDAKSIGRVLDYVARDGGVTITRRHEPYAVVIPVEAYARLVAADEGRLDTLSAEFDALLERMQQPGMAEAMERAFALEPEALGRAAVALARRGKSPVTPRRAAAKKQPRRR
jgi:prevent-host-death family protein